MELFTSQGCSSCPPAERWIGELKDSPKLWKEIVPVVFHVDYWDRLGWRDPFASKVFTKRQYDYRESKRVGSIYTPGFVVDGREWRGWFQGEAPPGSMGEESPAFSANIAGGILSMDTNAEPGIYRAHVALLGVGFETDVLKGENRGRRLPGDFVVLAFLERAVDASELKVEIPRGPTREPERYAVAVWLERMEDGEVASVAGGWVDRADLVSR